LLTGGGTAGHVNPNIALLEPLQKLGYSVAYAGSRNGIERDLMRARGVEYHGISAGKLRRYLSAKNFGDVFRVMIGFAEAVRLVRRIGPDVIFSKGGFVSVPVVAAGWLCRVPVVIHESDMSSGLANRLSLPFARMVCAAFPENMARLPKKKAVLTGTPVRKELLDGDKERGRLFCGFNGDKPVLLVMGGSSGSAFINNAVRQCLDRLTERFDVVHICGKGQSGGPSVPGYCAFEYLTEELPHVMALCDVVLSRAGANSISEFLALQKPALLVPLSRNASRGDQILNAQSFHALGFSRMLTEDELHPDTLPDVLYGLYENRAQYVAAMAAGDWHNGVSGVIDAIEKARKQ